MFLTYQNVFHFTCMLKILYNTHFFKVLYFFIKMIQQNKIQEKRQLFSKYKKKKKKKKKKKQS